MLVCNGASSIEQRKCNDTQGPRNLSLIVRRQLQKRHRQIAQHRISRLHTPSAFKWCLGRAQYLGVFEEVALISNHNLKLPSLELVAQLHQIAKSKAQIRPFAHVNVRGHMWENRAYAQVAESCVAQTPTTSASYGRAWKTNLMLISRRVSLDSTTRADATCAHLTQHVVVQELRV